MATTKKKTASTSKELTSTKKSKSEKISFNKKVVFDGNIRNNFKNNPLGIIGFIIIVAELPIDLLLILSNALHDTGSFVQFLDESQQWVFAIGMIMSIIGLRKKPNGLALIGLSIAIFRLSLKLILFLIEISLLLPMLFH